MKEPRRLSLLGATPSPQHTLPTWPTVAVDPGGVALAEVGARGEALRFALKLAEAWSARGRAPWLAVCEFDAAPQLSDEQVGSLRRVTQQLTLAPIRSSDDLIGLVAQARRDAGTAPVLFVGTPAVHGLGGVLKIVFVEEGLPAALTARARAMQSGAALVLGQARAGVALLLADQLGLPTTTP